MRRLLLATILILLGTAAPGAAELPIFDAHVHYSRPDWGVYSPERALSILSAAGVRRAIVSSTPDDGTLKLYEKSPKTIGPLPVSFLWIHHYAFPIVSEASFISAIALMKSMIYRHPRYTSRVSRAS